MERAETFDAMMGDIAECIENNQDPFLALDDNGIDDPKERSTIEETIRTMQRLHQEGRNHIWAYYTRNMVRPVALSRAKVDVVIGNPPWLTYNRTASIMREEMQRLSQDQYSIWAGGRYATQQNIAGLFFTRSTDLYLKDKGTIVPDYRTHVIGGTEPYIPKSKPLRFHPPAAGQPPASLC